MTHIRLRSDLAAGWASANPVLYDGELGWEKDTLKGKVGNGVTAWNSLPYSIVPVPTPPAASPVLSVAGRTGAVILTKSDVGLGNVDNTSDANKPVSTPQAAALAPINSPTFTGSPKAPTPFTSDNTVSIATTAFVKNQGYAPAASPTFTGDPKAPTPAVGDNDTSIATTAFVKAALSTMVETDGTNSYTPTSTANVAVTDLNTSFTSLGTTDRFWITLSADLNPVTASINQLVEVLVDGVSLFTLTMSTGRGVVYRGSFKTGLSAGTHNITVVTRLSAAGSGTMRSSLSVLTVERK